MTSRPWTLAFLLTLSMVASLAIVWTLAKDPSLRGSDAYYYALQANHWAQTGEVKIPDSSFIHRANGLLIRAGLSGESAFRGWIALSLFAAGATAALLLSSSAKAYSAGAFLLFLWLLFSPSLLFTAIEFPKMFSCLVFLPLWFLPLIPAKPHWPLAILVAVGTVLLHRAALPWALLFSTAVLGIFWKNPALRKKRFYLPLFGLIFLGAAYFIFFPDRIRWLDLSRLAWTQLRPGIFTLLSRGNLPFAIKAELVLTPALYLGVAILFCRHHRKQRGIALLPLALAIPGLFPFGGEEVFGVGERYAICLPILFLTGTIYLIGKSEAVGHAMAPALKTLTGTAALLLAATTAQPRLAMSHPTDIDPPFAHYQKVVAELQPKDIPMLIAQKGIVYFYKFHLKREAFPYDPEAHWPQARIWRVLEAITPEELNAYAPTRCGWTSGLIQGIPETDYFLIREDCWQEMRKGISQASDPELFERIWAHTINPAKRRPAFLYAKHRNDPPGEFSAFPP